MTWPEAFVAAIGIPAGVYTMRMLLKFMGGDKI
jgi:hypothetical protein